MAATSHKDQNETTIWVQKKYPINPNLFQEMARHRKPSNLNIEQPVLPLLQWPQTACFLTANQQLPNVPDKQLVDLSYLQNSHLANQILRILFSHDKLGPF